MQSPLAKLRAATAALHERIETLPYARAVLDGSVPLALYASFLRGVDAVHAELEQAVAMTGDASLRAILTPMVQRRALLAQDLAFLHADPLHVDAASLQALLLGQSMRFAALRNPAELLGHAYVLEGSQRGGLVQRAALAKRPELQSGGLAYLGSADRAEFKQFIARLEAALDSDALAGAAAAGAVAHFEGFEHILKAVDPSRAQDFRLAQELNHEAGTHGLPEHLREIEAALRAGERSYHETPYYGLRYGERGLRFTRSDSAWLVSLSREDEPEVRRQIGWLGRVLAARGMPRILLEQHLVYLHDALCAALPARSGSYKGLLSAARCLRAERESVLPRFDALVQSIDLKLEDEAGVAPREAALLLVSSVADELCRVPLAVNALCKWLLDPARFSPAWVAAGNEVLRRARSEAAPLEAR